MQHVIGLDIGTHSVKAMVLDVGQRLEVVAFDEERVLAPQPVAPQIPADAQAAVPVEGAAETQVEPEPTEVVVEEIDLTGQPLWVEPLHRLILRMDLTAAESIVAIMPDGHAMTVQLPGLTFNDRAKVSLILPNQLDDKLPIAIEDITYNFRLLTRGEQDHEAIVGFARNTQMKAVLEAFGIAQCDPRILYVPEWSLEFAVLSLLQQQDETYALLDIGHENTRVIVMQNKIPIMARTIKRGGSHITNELAEVFQVSIADAERLKQQRGAILPATEEQDPGLAAMSAAILRAITPTIRDLRRTFQSLYAKQRIRLDRIYVCGGSSTIGNLNQHFQKEFGVPIEPLPVGAMETIAEVHLSDFDKQRFVLAYGLALALGVEGNRDKLINLRQGAFVYKGRSSYVRQKLIRYGFAAAILLVMLGAALFMQQRELNAQRDAMRLAVGKETKKLFGSSVYTKTTVQKALTSEQEETKSLAPKMSAFKLMYEIVSRIDQNMTLKLTRIEVDANRNLIQVYGSTNNAQSVDKLVTELQKKLECIKDIRKDRLKVRSETEATFELQIVSACS